MRGELLGRCICALTLLLVLAISPITGAADEPEVGAGTITEVEEFLANQLADEGRPGLSAAIVVDDEIYPIHLGEAGDDVAVTNDTVFAISSLSKSITALAVALLAESGQVDMSDPVTHYVPELRPNADEITLADLMHMRSGISEYAGNEAWVGPRGDSLEANVVPLEPEFSNGADWEYSNANYDTLALVVERVSGQPFAEFLAEHIFEPLGMDHTHVTADGVADLSSGNYAALFVGYVPVDAETRPGMAGSAAIVSTSADVARFVAAQIDGGMIDGVQAIPVAAIDIVQEPRSYGIEFEEPPPVEPGYAGGLFVDGSFAPEVDPQLAGLTTLWHRGDQLGFQSAMWMMPEAGVGFVLLTNGNDYEDPDWTVWVAQGAKHILFGMEPPEPFSNQDPLQRWGKQLLLTVVVAQILLAFAVVPAIERRRAGRRLHGFDWVWVVAASIIDLAALVAIVWIIPETATSPLRVVMQAPDYRIIVILMAVGVVWGVIRTMMLALGEPGPRGMPAADEEE